MKGKTVVGFAGINMQSSEPDTTGITQITIPESYRIMNQPIINTKNLTTINYDGPGLTFINIGAGMNKTLFRTEKALTIYGKNQAAIDGLKTHMLNEGAYESVPITTVVR